MFKGFTAAFLALTVGAGLPVVAAEPNPQETPGAAAPTTEGGQPASQEATKVLASIHHANLMEIEMGNLAQDKGQSDAVKQYGEQLVNDHKQAEERTEKVAEQLDVKLLDKDQILSSKDHQKMKSLEAMSGAQFDKAFAQAMVEDHKKNITALEAAQKNLQGAAASLVTNLLPVLKKHQQTAVKLASQNPGT
jgi:putative membrane protein